MQSASFRARLAGRVVLITGASRGLGRATAELFTREGARLVLCARSRRPLESTRSAILRAGGDAIARPADISSPSEVRALILAALRRYGHLDVLINNAGILGPRLPVTDYPLRDWSRTVHIN
ncbi:MAG: SDR family NAD(P)-dependent oxidoreductase, partial [Nitrospirales bacterium]